MIPYIIHFYELYKSMIFCKHKSIITHIHGLHIFINTSITYIHKYMDYIDSCITLFHYSTYHTIHILHYPYVTILHILYKFIEYANP